MNTKLISAVIVLFRAHGSLAFWLVRAKAVPSKSSDGWHHCSYSHRFPTHLLGSKRKLGRKKQKQGRGINPKGLPPYYEHENEDEKDDLLDNSNDLQLNRRDRMAQILQRDGNNCTWCLTPLSPSSLTRATTDHMIAKVKGGPSWIDNEVAACQRCNELRGNIMPIQWMEFCQNNKGWEPNEKAVAACLLALDNAIQERGGQCKARPHLAKQLKRLGGLQLDKKGP